MQRAACWLAATPILTFSVKRKERLENLSNGTLTLRRAGASSFGIHAANRVLYTAPERTEKVDNRRRPCHQQQWAIEGTEESKDTPKQYSVLCLTWFWSSSKEKMPSPDITRSEGYWIFRKAEWVRIARYPSHRDKKAWCFWGVLVRWNVGLRLKTLKMSSKLRISANVPLLQANLWICFITLPTKAQQSTHPKSPKLNDSSNSSDLAMQGSMKICPALGLPWTYTVQCSECSGPPGFCESFCFNLFSLRIMS